MIGELRLEPFRDAILAVHPELASSTFSLLTSGWDSVAVSVDDRLIFKFPRSPQAERALVREAKLLEVVRPAVSLPVPALTLHRGPPLFSEHAMLPGEHLVPSLYETLPVRSRDRLAADLALFYHQLHELEPRVVDAAGAGPIREWLPAEAILRGVWKVLPERLRAYAERTLAAWQELPPDPHGVRFGFFDGHGWNMAFDARRERLNGVYDFGDAGIGPLQQEFIYTNFVSADLTARVMKEYQTLSGLVLDEERTHLLTGVLRLFELAEYAETSLAPFILELVAAWAAQPPPAVRQIAR